MSNAHMNTRIRKQAHFWFKQCLIITHFFKSPVVSKQFNAFVFETKAAYWME